MRLISFIAKLIFERYHKDVEIVKSSRGETILFNNHVTVVLPSSNVIICDWNDGDRRKEYKITDFNEWIEHWADELDK